MLGLERSLALDFQVSILCATHVLCVNYITRSLLARNHYLSPKMLGHIMLADIYSVLP